MIDWAAAATAFIGGGAGAFISGTLAARRTGREDRSAVLAPLAEVEHARWAYDEKDGRARLSRAAHALQSSAIVSGAPRELIETYLSYCEQAFHDVCDKYEVGVHDDEFGPSLDPHISVAVCELAEMIGDAAWRPVSSRWGRTERLRRLNAAFDGAGPVRRWEYSTWKRHHATTSDD